MSLLDRVNARHAAGRGKLKQFTQSPFWQTEALRGSLLGSSAWAADRETIEHDFEGYAGQAGKSAGPVFACHYARLRVFADGNFLWRDRSDGQLGPFYDSGELAMLRRPWPGGTLSNLLAWLEVDATYAGNSFETTVDDNGKFGNASRGGPGRRIVRMRPDWVTLVIGSHSDDPYALDAKVVGFIYQPPTYAAAGEQRDRRPVILMPDEVCHYAPIPDPLARFRGMSWVTPVLREIGADKAATRHKLKHFEHGATLQTVVTLDKDVSPEAASEFVAQFRAGHEGTENAYKCLHPDTDVAMWDGRRVPARDVAPGDVVVAWAEGRATPGTVSAAEWQPPSPIVTVTTQRGRVIRTNDRHPFLVGGRWVDAADLRPGDLLTPGLGWGDRASLDSLNAHEAWLLGVLTGDGCMVSTTPVVSVWDEGVRDRLRLDHGLASTGKGHDYRLLGVTKLARTAGLTGRRSWEKRIPESVMTGSAEVRAAFLAGLIDTDGHVSDPERRRSMELGITSTSRELLADAQHLLSSLGVNASVSCALPMRPGVKRNRDCWRLCAFGNEQARKLANLLDLACTAKAGRLARYAATPMINRQDRSRFDRIATVEIGPAEPTIGIEVAEHHTHVTGGVVTHNTLFMGGGADVNVVGVDMSKLDFRGIQGSGETRIAAAAGVHPVVVGLSESLSGSSLNAGNYGAARRNVADGTLQHLWSEAASSLETLFRRPRNAAELCIDKRDVAFVREDAKDIAEIQGLKARALRQLLDAGYEPDAAVAFLESDDLSRLTGRHSGLFSVQLQPPGSDQPDPNQDPVTDPGGQQ